MELICDFRLAMLRGQPRTWPAVERKSAWTSWSDSEEEDEEQEEEEESKDEEESSLINLKRRRVV